MVPFPVTLSDPLPRFQGHGVIFMPIDALSVLCTQLTRDLLAIAKFLLDTWPDSTQPDPTWPMDEPNPCPTLNCMTLTGCFKKVAPKTFWSIFTSVKYFA